MVFVNVCMHLPCRITRARTSEQDNGFKKLSNMLVKRPINTKMEHIFNDFQVDRILAPHPCVNYLFILRIYQ